jgi:hypothetical protein
LTGADALATASIVSSRSLCGDRLRFDLLRDRPNEADEFARDWGDDDRRLLAARQHATISGAQPNLRLSCDFTDRDRDRLLSQHYRLTDLRRQAIGPRSFDDQSPRDDASRFGDAGQLPLAATRALAWNETDEGHELAGIVEAPHVADPRSAWRATTTGPRDHSGTRASICASMRSLRAIA